MRIQGKTTTLVMTTDLSSKNVPESRDLVISYLHMSSEKCRIYSRKTETATNITIKKMTESLDYNTILEVTDDEGEIHLLQNLKYILIVVFLV